MILVLIGIVVIGFGVFKAFELVRYGYKNNCSKVNIVCGCHSPVYDPKTDDYI